MSTAIHNTSWNKVMVICSTIGFPILSVLVAVIVWGARVDNKLNTIVTTLSDHGTAIKEIRSEIKGIHGDIDTIRSRQKDNINNTNMQIYKIEHPYQQGYQWSTMYHDEQGKMHLKKANN